MKETFQHELENLKLKVLQMAAIAKAAFETSYHALTERNADMGQAVIEGDEAIDRLEVDVDNYCMRLIALEQPVAHDLRFIIGSMHAADGLESIADQAVKISKRAIFFASRPPLPFDPLLEKMFFQVRDMLDGVVNAYNREDAALAEEVCLTDRQVNELNDKILHETSQRMACEPTTVDTQVQKIITARCIERIGDLVVNIGQNVILIKKGVNIKHHIRKS